MKPATEEFLYLLLWTADTMMAPTWRNIVDGSFESWAYRKGLGRRLAELERLKLVERRPGPMDERIYRLTSSGRLAALGGVDPSLRWNRAWDGRWRLVLFDLPESENRQRVRLRRVLRDLGFGYLQNSVWLSPDPLDEVRAAFQGAASAVESLTLFEGRPAGGESDQDLVAGAWNFREIDELYTRWFRVAASAPAPEQVDPREPRGVRAWAQREREAWNDVVRRDPFLPAALLPAGYNGRKAWVQRTKLLTAFGRALSSPPAA